MKKIILLLNLMVVTSWAGASPKTLIVFVSLSMPEASLKSLFWDAQKQGGRLIVRGLYKNSFQEMKRRMEALKINVDVDPSLFEAYGVTKVPTFVLVKDKEVLKCAGNVSVGHALEVLQK